MLTNIRQETRNSYELDYSNRLHQMLMSVSGHYYILNNSELKYQKKRVQITLKTLTKSSRDHLVHYILRDSSSQAFYAEVHSSRSLVSIQEFLYRAWSKKENYFFCGLPEYILVPSTILILKLQALVESLGIIFLEPLNGFDAGVRVIRDWENKIMQLYFYYRKLNSFGELQSRCVEICESIKDGDFSGETYATIWKKNLKALVMPPEKDSFYTLASLPLKKSS